MWANFSNIVGFAGRIETGGLSGLRTWAFGKRWALRKLWREVYCLDCGVGC